jgi:lysophospholipase L1-like esterase
MSRSRLLAAVAGFLAAGQVVAGLFAAAPAAEAPTVVLDMDTVRHRPGEMKDKDGQAVPVGTIEAVEGKVGKACRFTFREGEQSGFMTLWVNATPDWDQAEALSFWVKGDGSTSWGGLELIDGDDYALRYGYCFPIDSTEWTKVVMPWRDLLPELAGPVVGPKGGYAPSKFRNIWFGKWFYWREYPAHAYAIDQVALEKGIDLDRADYTPERPGAARTLARLKAKQPVTIVTMGDSLSDKRHWANRQVLWSELLVKRLKETYGGEVTLVNPAMGGTTLTQNLIVMPRWLKDTPRPDLVTVWLGFNDWDSGVRGERFKEYLRLAVDRIRRMTKGAADVLLVTTCPAHDRWDTGKDLEEAARAVAAEKKTALADVAAAFHQVATPAEALQQGYWVDDKVHLGKKGHEVAADVVMKAIASGQ